jgi:hypothetical protein
MEKRRGKELFEEIRREYTRAQMIETGAESYRFSQNPEDAPEKDSI